MTTSEILTRAKEAKSFGAALETGEKNRLLLAMADSLEAHAGDILAANAEDVARAEGVIAPVMIDRLLLTPERIKAMADGVRAVAALPDPVGEVVEERTLENGLALRRVRVPMGVIAIIYESRPNVTSDAAALCVKSGSACVLRGGKEAFCSNDAVVKALRAALAACGADENLVNLVQDTTRASSAELMTARGLVDLLIPRGGAGLIRACVEGATVPCIETGTGICHVYVDRAADLDMAERIIFNAKTSRPSVCNAAEVCLVHRDVAEAFLPRMKRALDEKHVELRLCPRAAQIIDGTPAGPKDFDTEFLDYILAVRVVDSIDEAVAAKFARAVDSAAVYVNASTRFTDGGVFGLGCEMGISTQKLHARGPMGLRELTSCKYVLTGTGQVR